MKSVENRSISHGRLSLLFVMKAIMIVRHIESIVFCDYWVFSIVIFLTQQEMYNKLYL